MEAVDVVVVGAGPCGIAAGIALDEAGMSSVLYDRNCIVSGIVGYPTYMTFFSTAERLSIGGIPFVVATEKPTRRDALAYYRAVAEHFRLDVRQYESVERIERAEDGPFIVHTRSRAHGGRATAAAAIVVATGYFGRPNELGVRGEGLPHVTHRFKEGHEAFGQPVVVVGGGNSAVDAALDLYRSGARVTLLHFGASLDRNIKPWILPDITNRIADGSIAAHWSARVRKIEADVVTIESPAGEKRIPAHHVYLMIGYMPETHLLESLGVPMDSVSGVPAHDPATMETTMPGVFIAGVLASGFNANKTFIENGRGHGDLIARALLERSGARQSNRERE